MVALTVVLLAVVAPVGLLVVVGATRGFVVGKPVEVRAVVAVLAGPVVGLGAADTGALAVAGALADAVALAGAADLAAGGLAAVTDLAPADEGLAAVVVVVVEVVLAVALAAVDVTVLFWMGVGLASPLTSFLSEVAAGFLSAVPTVLVRVVAATFGDLTAPMVDVLAAAVGPVVAGVFFAAGTVVVLAAAIGFAAGLVVDGLAAAGAFFVAPTVAGALTVFPTELTTGSGVLGLGAVTSSLVLIVSWAGASSSIGLTSSMIDSSLTMVGTGSAVAGTSIDATVGVISGICSTATSFLTTHSSSSTGLSCCAAIGTGEMGAS